MPRVSAGVPYFLAIDLGSSSVRAGIASEGGPPLEVVRRPLVYRDATEQGALATELDAERTWRNAATAAKAARLASRVPPRSIAAVGVTSQRQGVVLLDRGLDVVLAVPNTDMRAVFHGAAIDEEIGDLVWRTTGHLPSFMQAWSKLRWLREEAPADYERVRYVCTLADWLVLKLSGVLVVERAAGVEAGLVDVTRGSPTTEIAKATGLDGPAIPALVDAGTIVGGLTARAADALGLRPGIPVVPAGPDSQSALVCLGGARPGNTGIVAGWSCAVQRVTASPLFDPERGLWTGRHVLKGRWVLEGNAGVMGGAYEWLATMLRPRDDRLVSMESLDRSAYSASPGTHGVTAHLGPALVNMSRPALRAGGFVFPVPLALEAPDAGSLGKAVLEGFAFGVRANVDRLSAVAGSEPPSIALGGGMARSATFIRALAAVMGKPIRVGHPETSVMGAASISAAALDHDGSLERRAQSRLRELRTVRPGSAQVAQYAELYEKWCERASALEKIYL